MIDVINPVSGDLAGRVQESTPDSCDSALEKAKGVGLSFPERIRVLKRLHKELADRARNTAEIISSEQGKPLIEALTAEILPSLDHLRFAIRRYWKELAPRRVPSAQIMFSGKKSHKGYKSKGTILTITPWNYPFAIPFIHAVQAVASGNAAVIKCSPLTPLSAGVVEDLFRCSGAPEGLVQRLILKGPETERLLEDDRINHVVFTGSTEVGRQIAVKCAERLKSCTLEMGGKDAALVLADADLDVAVPGILWGCVMNAGQTCASIERVYVARTLYDEFITRMVDQVKHIRMGNPLDPNTELGPMTSEQQRQKVHSQVMDAVEKGAETLYGGEIPDGEGFYYPPTILKGTNHTMMIMRDETFGPVIPVMPFDHEMEAVTLANDSSYGLTASVWTRSEGRAQIISESLECGSVTINDHLFTFAEPSHPWVGVKNSGLGVTHGLEGMRELSDVRVLSKDFHSIPRAWWYPYNDTMLKFFLNSVEGLHGTGTGKVAGILKLSTSRVFWKKAPWFSILSRFWRLF